MSSLRERLLDHERLMGGESRAYEDEVNQLFTNVGWAWSGSRESPSRQGLKNSGRHTFAGDMCDYYPDDAELEAVFARFAAGLD